MATQTFTLVNIILLESNFQREWILDVNNKDFKNHFDIDLSSVKNTEHLMVTVTVKFSAGVGEKREINAVIKMVGVFTIPTDNELPLDTFTNVNAPAIIFPFLREHLASLSMKAGINTILLQPVNFVKAVTDKKSDEIANAE